MTRLIATAAFGNALSLHVLQKQGFHIIGEKILTTAKGTDLRCHSLELKKIN